MQEKSLNITCPLCNNSETQIIFNIAGRHYIECANCDLLFCNPFTLLTFAEEKARYLSHQNTYSDTRYVKHLQRLSNQLIPYLVPKSRGVDYGCGHTPVMSKILAAEGFAVDNYDPYFNFNIELNKSKYDFVICSEVVEHFKSPIEEFAKIKSLLKSKGIIAIMTNLRSADRRTSGWWYLKDPTHCCFYSPRTFEVISKIFDLNILSLSTDVVLLKM